MWNAQASARSVLRPQALQLGTPPCIAALHQKASLLGQLLRCAIQLNPFTDAHCESIHFNLRSRSTLLFCPPIPEGFEHFAGAHVLVCNIVRELFQLVSAGKAWNNCGIEMPTAPVAATLMYQALDCSRDCASADRARRGTCRGTSRASWRS